MCNGAAKYVSAGVAPCNIKNLLGNIITGLKIHVPAIIQNDPYDSSDTVVRIELRSISTTETTLLISYTTSGNCQRRLI